MIEIVVFDMDGVLCRTHRDRRLALLASWSGKPPEEIYESIWLSGFEDEAERGLVSADDYLRGTGERIGYPLTAEQWIEARRSTTEPDLDVLALARELSARRPVGMFTNNPWLLKRHFAEVFPPAADLFGERAVFSAELGCSKPDPEAFRRLARRLGCEPREVLFFDDWPSYVAGAEDAGLCACHVDGVESVRAGLAAHGFLADS